MFYTGWFGELIESRRGRPVTEEPSLEDLGREVAGTEEEVVSEVDSDEMDGDGSLSIEQELFCLAQARSILERSGNLCDAGREAFFV